MPTFSKSSQSKLDTCHPYLQLLFEEVIKHYDCTILEGHRNNAKQTALYDAGKSKLEAGQSKHNKYPSLAIDVAPYPIDWQDTKRFYHFAGVVQGIAYKLGLKIRWGGDWDSDNDLNDQSFNDLVHFEIVE